ncbi:MFS general substrate transporter [Aspergillus californicus]
MPGCFSAMSTTGPFKGKLRLSRPFNQNFIMGWILFALPGIYLALTGLGAGGGRPSSQRVASLTNSILYGIYTLAGWCAGSALNYLGPKWTVVLGGFGYPFYVGSLWYYDKVGHEAFPLFGGALLGVTAALLWTTSGFIQFAYAEENDKAKYITIQWVLNSFGGTVGALVAFGANIHQFEATGVSTGVWIAFILIMCCALVAAVFLIIHPRDVVRDDGRHLATFKEPSIGEEMKGIFSVLTDPRIIILLPAMFVAEMCLAVFSSVNGYYFNLRTRSLNNVLFQAIMIPTPILLNTVLSSFHLPTRRARGLAGTIIVGVLSTACMASLLGWLKHYGVDRNEPAPAIDWTDPAFSSLVFIYLLNGMVYACFQIMVQWVLGALTNDPALCARYAGAFKGTVSLGMCISFTMDSQGVSYVAQTIVQLVLYVVGVVCMGVVVVFYVRDTNYFLEGAVIVPEAVEERLVKGGAVEEVHA